MISEIILKSALNKIISTAFKGAHIYSQGITEGYKYPAVFSELKLTNMTDATINVVEKNYLATLTYMPKKPNEEDNLTKFSNLVEALKCVDARNRRRKMCIKVSDGDDDRFIQVTDLSYVYVGDNFDTMKIQFNLRFYDSEKIVDPEPIMQHVEQNNTLMDKIKQKLL